MNTAEQIQLSYVNQTNYGINMIVSWLSSMDHNH